MDQFLIFAQFLHQVIWKSGFPLLKLSPPAFSKILFPLLEEIFPKIVPPPDPRGGGHTMKTWKSPGIPLLQNPNNPGGVI